MKTIKILSIIFLAIALSCNNKSPQDELLKEIRDNIASETRTENTIENMIEMFKCVETQYPNTSELRYAMRRGMGGNAIDIKSAISDSSNYDFYEIVDLVRYNGKGFSSAKGFVQYLNSFSVRRETEKFSKMDFAKICLDKKASAELLNKFPKQLSYEEVSKQAGLSLR